LLRSISELTVGQKIDVPGVEITEVINRYWNQGFFSNVKILADSIVGNKIYLHVELTPQPRISSISYSGVKKSEREDIEERLGLQVGSQITPDMVNRAKLIIERYFEDKGFKIVGMKLLQVTPELAAKHYAEHVGKSFYNRLIYYITSAPIVAMVVQGYNAVDSVRHMVGATNPLNADVGTIRADFAQIMEYNVVHASDSLASAEREIDIYFKPEEIYDNWQSMPEMIAYDEERYNQQGL
jgi:nucleoside diphosphate kinase